jgi:hypothetical protein
MPMKKKKREGKRVREKRLNEQEISGEDFVGFHTW